MIAGSPEGVEAGAAELGRGGTALLDAAESVAAHGRAVTADWQGTASDAARDACDLVAARTGVGADAVTPAEQVLRTYAAQLRAAQQAWTSAEAALGAARQRQGAAQTAARDARHDPDGQDAQRRATRDAHQAGEDVDAAQASMASAEQRALAANQTAAAAIDRLTGQLDAMTLQPPAPPPPPPPPPPVEQDGGFGWGDFGHLVLDGVGLIPVVGEPADLANAAWYEAEGDHLNAGLSAAGAIPLLGWGATGVKGVRKGTQAIDAANDARKAADAAAAARQADLPLSQLPSTYRRPSGFRKGVRDEVLEANRGVDGLVRDPLTGRVINPSSRWDMGHRPGYEFRKHANDAYRRGIDRRTFLDEHNNPNHYWPELPSSNSGHTLEDTSDVFLGP